MKVKFLHAKETTEVESLHPDIQTRGLNYKAKLPIGMLRFIIEIFVHGLWKNLVLYAE